MRVEILVGGNRYVHILCNIEEGCEKFKDLCDDVYVVVAHTYIQQYIVYLYFEHECMTNLVLFNESFLC